MIVKALQALALSVGFTLLLLVIYAVHARSFPVGVIFYSAILDAVIACAGLAVMAWLLRRHLVLTGFECGLLVMIWLLGGYAFAISGPTVLDRSLSFYILEKLQQRGGGIERAAMERVFVEEYIPEYRLMDVRMTEQLQSGTIEIRNGCVMLTPLGGASGHDQPFHPPRIARPQAPPGRGLHRHADRPVPQQSEGPTGI